jgi:hypothetical protein
VIVRQRKKEGEAKKRREGRKRKEKSIRITIQVFFTISSRE